ncbi:DUF2141 domain-containing protein [Marinoscillum furvescens]|uniref:Uncharacterized protein (DUF2141 family) n=1 Tax=Marinoscillum furvescens DSM 4134 TaxID=1122208 RepID=A0A3D9LGS8_MARFU|nr:DUF2141 domain-containing protein [Marinoscillum furvescens]REE05581.1 uncharacterized protein (DUF2141 family) [Marinoscillum furvescens DSM 4134]
MNWILAVLILTFAQQSRTLTLQVTGVEAAGGTLRVAVYDSEENFMNEEQIAHFAEERVKDSGPQKVTLQLPDGVYALAIYHDLNDDQELNTNLLGVPKEAYGFSNNVMGTFGPPSFQEASFSVSDDTILAIDLR